MRYILTFILKRLCTLKTHTQAKNKRLRQHKPPPRPANRLEARPCGRLAPGGPASGRRGGPEPLLQHRGFLGTAKLWAEHPPSPGTTPLWAQKSPPRREHQVPLLGIKLPGYHVYYLPGYPAPQETCQARSGHPPLPLSRVASSLSRARPQPFREFLQITEKPEYRKLGMTCGAVHRGLPLPPPLTQPRANLCLK